MTLLLFLAVAPFLALKVLLRRLVRGRRRPTWSALLEVLIELLSWLLRRTAGRLASGRLAFITPRLRERLATATERRPATLAGLRAEWISPAGQRPRRLVLYLHGGAWVTCSIDTHRDLMCRLALAAEARVVGIDYRLAPQHPFPAGLDDCVAAWRALVAAGEDPRSMVLAGDSAGGNLAAATLLTLRDAGEPLPAGAVLISPAVELGGARPLVRPGDVVDYLAPLAEQQAALLQVYVGGGPGSARHPLVSPLHARLEGLPPLLLQAGDAEVLYEQIVAFHQKARAAGVAAELDVGKDMVHVWHMFAAFEPEARRAIARAGEFIRQRTPG